MSHNFKVFLWTLWVMLIVTMSLLRPVGDYVKEANNKREIEEQTNYVTTLIDKMKNGDLRLARNVVIYCHTATSSSSKVDTPLIKIDTMEDADIALSLWEAEARYYAAKVTAPKEPGESWSSRMPDIKRAWFYAELTGGLEKYSLTMKQLETMWKLGAKELEEQSDPESGGYAMVPVIIDKNSYQIVTPLGPVVPPGGIDGMAQEIFDMAKKIAKK